MFIEFNNCWFDLFKNVVAYIRQVFVVVVVVFLGGGRCIVSNPYGKYKQRKEE